MDFIEVVSQTAPAFRERKLIYFHCLDLGAQESVQFEQFTCLQVKLVLGHVSFPEKIAERRMCGFLFQKKVIDVLKDRQSPILLEVINSCDIKVSFSAFHSLVFGLAWLWLHSLFSAIEAHFHCCVHTCTDHDRINLLRFPYRLNTVLSEGKILRKLSSFNEPFPTCLTALILGQASRRSLLGLVCVWIIH